MIANKISKNKNLDICKYIIIGNSYFDFKGAGGLIKRVKEYVPDHHWVLKILNKKDTKPILGRVVSFRNFACHESEQSKVAAKKSIDAERLTDSAGEWLRKEKRFEKSVEALKKLSKSFAKEANKYPSNKSKLVKPVQP